MRKEILIKVLVVVAGLFLLSASNTFAGHFCKADCDGDCKVGLTDLVQMKTEFMDPECEACSPPYPAPIEKTWQTFCYNDYDDGWMQKGVAWPDPRFTDNGDGSVTDNLTGLVWLQDANCGDVQASDWWNALNNAYFLHGQNGTCGLWDGSYSGDWRMPNVKELQSLIDYGSRVPQEEPALPEGNPFVDVSNAAYWTSTTYRVNAGYALIVDIGTGVIDYRDKTYLGYVWPVRGGQ